MHRFKFLNKNKVSQIPKTTGIYAFKKGAKLLYVGKAGNIRERVKNHFQQNASRENFFVNQASEIGFIKTDSEIEALISEADLIKKYQPKYNVVWRDDKNYFYAAITKEKFPKVFLTHQPKFAPGVFHLASKNKDKKIQNIKFIGPFVDGKSLKQTLKILRRIFPYRSCKNLPKTPCLWYQLDRCPAPCLIKSDLAKEIVRNKVSKIKKECQKNSKNLIKVLQGKKKDVLADFKKEMKKYSESQNFEKAAKIRDQIRVLEKVLSHAKIFENQESEYAPTRPSGDYYGWKETEKTLKKLLGIKNGGRITKIEAYDVSNIQGKEAAGSMVAFINGQPDKNFYRKFKIKMEAKPNDTAMLKEVLNRRFKHPEWGWPDLILIDGGKAQLNAALKCLETEFKKVRAIALVKKKNELYFEGRKKPILLKNLPRGIFNLMLQLRDEAHRFAISYHKKLRNKALIA